MQSPLLSAALQDRLAAGMYHCNYTYEALLVIQVCSDPTPVHCITVLCKMQCTQCCSATALQVHCYTCMTAITPMKLCCSYRCAVNQHQCTASLLFAKCSHPLLSAALQDRLAAGMYHCITAVTPTKLCWSYRCAVTQHQCTATLFFAKCSAHSSVLLCKTGL